MALKRHSTVQAVAGTIRRHGLLPDGAGVVVGLSGGPDSVALAAILRELSLGRRRWRLTLAHLNHGLRGTAQRDEAFVAELAAGWGLPLVSRGVKVRDLAAARKEGIEEAARSARYDFLQSVAEEVGATHVAVGHHRDDQAETVLMNVLRGSGVRGLSGMPMARPIVAGGAVTLVRPLLDVSRDELTDYLQARGLEWVEDETNRSPTTRRNRVRHELLPLLEREYSPGVSGRLVQMAENVRSAAELLAVRAAAAWDGAVTAATGRSVTFDLERLAAEGRAVACEMLLAALERIGAGRGAVMGEHLSGAWRMIAGERGGTRLELPGGVTISRRGKHLRVARG